MKAGAIRGNCFNEKERPAYPVDGDGMLRPRSRFSICHELGHYYIDAHRDLLMRAGPHNSLSGFVCDNQIEREADAFAAALLIPRENLDLRLRKRGFLDLRGVIDVARDFQTSVQCAAVRYAQLTGEACYVIVARAGRIFYQTPSDEARAWRVGRVFHFDCQIDHCSQQIAVNRHFAFRTPSPTA